MTKTKTKTILEVLDQVFVDAFRPAASWSRWRAFLAALFGLPMTPEELEIFREHTGRAKPPAAPCPEGWCVVGRRGGKSRIAALVLAYLGCFRDYGSILAPGERGIVMCLAQDRAAAKTVFRYVVGLLEGVPALAELIEKKTSGRIRLRNGIDIEVHTSDFRAVRSYTIVGCVLDEVAFWPTGESAASPDTETIAAIRPAMATVPGAVLLGISSPYARRGSLFEATRDHWGKDGDPVLVWRSDTGGMNPSIDRRIVLEAYEKDESSAAAEWGGEFRKDRETFVSREAVAACTVDGRVELPSTPIFEYVGFCDPSGGSQDSACLAIAHVERRRVRGGGQADVAVLDRAIEVRAPHSPALAVAEFCRALTAFGLDRVFGDRYGGKTIADLFEACGQIQYVPAEDSKSDIYHDLLPLLNSGRVELLDSKRLLAQLLALEAGRRPLGGETRSITQLEATTIS